MADYGNGALFAISFSAVAVSAAQDLFEITSPATTRVAIDDSAPYPRVITRRAKLLPLPPAV